MKSIRSLVPPAFLVRLLLLLTPLAALRAAETVTISGIREHGVYTDYASFRIETPAGHTAQATLSGRAVPVGTDVTVDGMDHYELVVTATPTSGGPAKISRRQFIVRHADRGRPETGLMKWVPTPPIPSASGEFADARLDLMHPARYPRELDLPIVAWVRDAADQARRVNGVVRVDRAAGSDPEDFRLIRGTGFGLTRMTNAGRTAFKASVGPLRVERNVELEAATTWTSVGGELAGRTEWPANARISVDRHLAIPAGATLEIGAGTVVRLQPGVTITNAGRIRVRGTTDNPVTFTAAQRVAPEQAGGAWGGFILSEPGAEVAAEAAVFTGSGANTRFPFPPRASHRPEQALFFATRGTRIALTNCALINHAGQIGNGNDADITFDRCLVQRAITAGEYVGGNILIRDSAFIEFPSIDDAYDAKIAESDYDAIYFTTGRHVLLNSLFAWAKDDAIDSGSGGAGTVLVSNCWVEAAWHEGLAWSGGGRKTWTYDSVLLNNGQALESGWSTGDNSPLCVGERLLILGNGVGARFGDNYEGTTGLGSKRGFLWVTNSLLLHNHRDVWGRVWDDTWEYRADRMDVSGNWLTAPNPHHPDNRVWNAAADAGQLRPFLRSTVDAKSGVGIGLALWSARPAWSAVSNGIPIGLSTFSPTPVSVECAVTDSAGNEQTGTVRFAPGEIVKRFPLRPGAAAGAAPGKLRIRLTRPTGGELTGLREAEFGNP